MYKCSCCGYVFEEPKKYLERHGLDTGPYEPFLCCPECGGDYEEALVCDVCGVTQYADDLTPYYSTDGKGRQVENNICDDCLSKAITVKSFREFGQTGAENDDITHMVRFVFSEFLDCDPPRVGSCALRIHCNDTFDSIYNPAVFGKNFEYLPDENMMPIKHYILLDNDVKEAFAQWLGDGGDGQA